MNDIAIRILSVTVSTVLPVLGSIGLATSGTAPSTPTASSASSAPSAPATAAATTSRTASDARASSRQEDGLERPALSDRLIADAVEDEIEADPRVDLNWLSVGSTNGAVTIGGTADDLLSKRRATRLARTVRGVREVSNVITVPTSEKTGSELAADVESALLLNVATDSFEIDASADDAGRVVLEGSVGSNQERTLAERVAASVRGVTSIENDLELDLDDVRTDAELRQEIVETLQWNVRVDHELLDVRVRNGRVILDGSAGSVAELERAIDLAWVLGVREVDASGVEVIDGEDAARSRGPGDMEPWTDEDIAGATARVLRYDPLVDAEDVAVESEDGRVTLRGTVKSLQARRAATIAAEDVVGVDRVRNRLRVRPGADLSDEQIETRIERAIGLDPWLDANRLDAEVEDGTATLSGEVEGAFEHAHATATVAAVEGVTRVINRAEADGVASVFMYDPWVDWWPRESAIITAATSPMIDSEYERRLEDDVESQLFWSPFVDSDNIVVDVQGGEVRLSGIVEDEAERQAAVENAWEGGAMDVVDRLVIADATG